MKEELLQILPSLRRYAFSLTGNRDDADDLVQSAVEKVLTKQPPEGVSLSAWLFRICRNQWIDQYRSDKVKEQHATEMAHLSDNTDNTLESKISLIEVNNAMQTLPDEQRELIGLVAIEAKPYKEIAQMLQVPIGTVMSRVARARVALQKQLNLQPLGGQ